MCDGIPKHTWPALKDSVERGRISIMINLYPIKIKVLCATESPNTHGRHSKIPESGGNRIFNHHFTLFNILLGYKFINTFSGVMGEEKDGRANGLNVLMAFRRAKNAPIPYIKGGSPTAFE